jgi:hypothetical protein
MGAVLDWLGNVLRCVVVAAQVFYPFLDTGKPCRQRGAKIRFGWKSTGLIFSGSNNLPLQAYGANATFRPCNVSDFYFS